ncbi:MAG: transposase [Actinobacteria bacterium]|nr:transposase [Actinomycetota bacterium]
MRSHYRINEKDGVYFVTSTILQWIPIFTSKVYFDILISAIKYCQENKNLFVYAYVILENHFHMICYAPELGRIMQSLKRHTAKMIMDQLQKEQKSWVMNLLSYYKKRHKHESIHQLWEEGFHPQQILNEEMLVQKIEYIHYNPVKRGYVLKPEYWAYSSAGDFYLNEEGYIKLQELPV